MLPLERNFHPPNVDAIRYLRNTSASQNAVKARACTQSCVNCKTALLPLFSATKRVDKPWPDSRAETMKRIRFYAGLSNGLTLFSQFATVFAACFLGPPTHLLRKAKLRNSRSYEIHLLQLQSVSFQSTPRLNISYIVF